MRNVIICLLILISANTIHAQSPLEDEIAEPINLTGPRIGFTYLGNVYTNAINNDPYIHLSHNSDGNLKHVFLPCLMAHVVL